MASLKALVLNVGLIISCIAVVEPAEILVGGKPRSWRIPASPLESLNAWSRNLRFAVNDSLGKHACVCVFH